MFFYLIYVDLISLGSNLFLFPDLFQLIFAKKQYILLPKKSIVVIISSVESFPFITLLKLSNFFRAFLHIGLYFSLPTISPAPISKDPEYLAPTLSHHLLIILTAVIFCSPSLKPQLIIVYNFFSLILTLLS